MKEKKIRTVINKFGRLKLYFLRGHSQWFVYVFSLTNFSLLFYNFLFKNLRFIPEALKQFYIFFSLFIILYVPIAMIIGYFDFKKGTFKAEQMVMLEMSPIWKKMFIEINIIRNQLDIIQKEVNDLKEVIKNESL